MKRSLTFIMAILLVTTVFAQQADTGSKEGPKIAFEEKTFDFGDIEQGDRVEHVFNFKNTGTQPLILTNVQTTCGCTVPRWPREPIAPGASAQITVQFNSSGKMGKVNKIIKIVSNSVDPLTQISITTNILPKKTADPN